MGDVYRPVPVRTNSPGDVVSKIVDGTTPSQALAVDASGRLGVKNYDAAGNGLTSTLISGKQALDVNLANTIETGVADESSFTYGTSLEQPIGGVFQDTSPSISAGQTGAVRITANRAMHHNLRDSSGNELLGQKAMAASVPVAIASDQSAYPVNQGSPNTVGSAWPVAIALGGSAVSSTNPFPVQLLNTPIGALVNKYNSSGSVAAGASVNHDYTITTSKTFTGKKFWASSTIRLRVDVQTSPDGSTFTTFWTGFTNEANLVLSDDLGWMAIQDSGTGSKIRLVLTNEDPTLPADVFSTISGTEQ